MSEKIRILRDVRVIVDGAPKSFRKGVKCKASMAKWLPEDSYEPNVPREPLPIPYEIKVQSDV